MKGEIAFNMLPPLNKVEAVKKKNVANITEEKYSVGDKYLERTKQGKNKGKQEKCPVLARNNIYENLGEALIYEASKCVFQSDEEELVVVFTGDLSNFNTMQRDITSFCIFNKEDEDEIILWPIVMGGCTDTTQNIKVTHAKILPQIRDLNNKTIMVNGVERKIRTKTCLDMKAEDSWLGKSTSSATFPDTHTNITQDEMRNHGAKPYGPKYLKKN